MFRLAGIDVTQRAHVSLIGLIHIQKGVMKTNCRTNVGPEGKRRQTHGRDCGTRAGPLRRGPRSARVTQERPWSYLSLNRETVRATTLSCITRIVPIIAPQCNPGAVCVTKQSVISFHNFCHKRINHRILDIHWS